MKNFKKKRLGFCQFEKKSYLCTPIIIKRGELCLFCTCE